MGAQQAMVTISVDTKVMIDADDGGTGSSNGSARSAFDPAAARVIMPTTLGIQATISYLGKWGSDKYVSSEMHDRKRASAASDTRRMSPRYVQIQ